MFNWFNKEEKKEERKLTGSSWLSGLFNESYVSNSVKNSLSIATAYACIKVKSDKISSTKLKFYNETKKGNEELKTHRLSKLMKKPYRNMTYNRWMNYMISNLELYGNAYAIIKRNKDGYPIELKPLEVFNVVIMKSTIEDQPHFYQVTINGIVDKILDEDMIHFKNISIDGVKGINPLEYHKLTFDSANSQNSYHKYFLDNMTAISGVIETEKKLSAEAVEDLRNNFTSKFSGKNNAGKTPVLPEGLKYKQLNMLSPLDTDYINTKKLTEDEIARIYGVPLSMLGDNGSTYANAEQDNIKFNEITLQPIEDMISEELNIKLINFYLTSSNYFEFAHESINLSSAKDKADLISQLKREGIITPNEARAYYNKQSIEGGDNLIIQINTAPQYLVEEKMKSDIDSTVKNTENIGNEINTFNTPIEEPKKEEENSNEEMKLEVDNLKRYIQQIKSDLGRLKK